LGGAARGAQTQGILKSGDRIDVGGDAKEIIERAYALGHQYEARYGGCAQCTLAALQDAIPFVPTDKGLFRGASALDGGSTPTGVQNCGVRGVYRFGDGDWLPVRKVAGEDVHRQHGSLPQTGPKGV